MNNEQFQALISHLRNYHAIMRVVLQWRDGDITAPLAMEQIYYITTEIDNSDTAD